jgi:hypothetical protein
LGWAVREKHVRTDTGLFDYLIAWIADFFTGRSDSLVS